MKYKICVFFLPNFSIAKIWNWPLRRVFVAEEKTANVCMAKNAPKNGGTAMCWPLETVKTAWHDIGQTRFFYTLSLINCDRFVEWSGVKIDVRHDKFYFSTKSIFFYAIFSVILNGSKWLELSKQETQCLSSNYLWLFQAFFGRGSSSITYSLIAIFMYMLFFFEYYPMTKLNTYRL